MLFSDDRIASFINDNFEPTWKNVREVPIVTIDFGGGNVLTRTLHGNIATHVCTADGKLLDVLPGVYEPVTYLDRLDQFVKLHRWVAQGPEGVDDAIVRYHQQQAQSLARDEAALVFKDAASFRTKRKIEGAVRVVLAANPNGSVAPRAAVTNVPASQLKSRDDLARWSLLAEDTRINETVRRRQIHDHLAGQLREGPVTPHFITKWLYREVLHADLEDPYLGLGKLLFADYPFDDGHSRRGG